MIVVETERLTLRRLDAGDAAFILDLVNQPSWLRFIGDRGVRSLDDARAYIADGPVAMYRRLGFGLYLAARRPGAERAGICGLIRRDGLDDVDLGFAFLPAHWGQGLAREAAAAVLADGHGRLGLGRIVAITAPDNRASIGVLEAVGFRFERTLRLSADAPERRLYAHEAG